MTKDEALKMAYDWLNEYAPTEVVEACKKALEQPAQSEYMVNEGGTGTVLRKSAPAWQGLSDKDVMDLTNFWNISDIEIEPFITMVANKVKEKNNGI